ncbi:unnamed protein product [Rhizoctonia solani]|uniref:Uncharacterized protein n=1 Tax=Rhizoctonia solani TaxID=456999 RepID=A0A8H3B9G6_9AGAM|nr:unnamed protein product [Rhizoctonia solani]
MAEQDSDIQVLLRNGNQLGIVRIPNGPTFTVNPAGKQPYLDPLVVGASLLPERGTAAHGGTSHLAGDSPYTMRCAGGILVINIGNSNESTSCVVSLQHAGRFFDEGNGNWSW